MKFVEGGVCASYGFKANGIHCGVRKNRDKKDVALIVSDVLCNAAGVYTTNLVKGAPLIVSKEHLKNGKAQAIICNSGNANTCNANGIEIAEGMANLVEKAMGISASDVIVGSTGVIGMEMSLEPFENGIDELVAGLAYNKSSDANQAIMTTDTKEKSVAVEFELDGKICHVGGIAKGSGMIRPNMATMLVYLTSDVAISSKMLEQLIKEDVKDSFNMVSVDGDTSTNDMLVLLANGLAGNKEIDSENKDYFVFKDALAMCTQKLCKMMAKDGEGATKLVECEITGAKDIKNAKIIAKSVIMSNLVKAAMFGSDANWGRVLCAIGYSGADVDINKVDVDFVSSKGSVPVCRQGSGIPFDEDTAKVVLLEDEILIKVTLGDGNASATAWGCDLTYDYVKINGDYRT